MGKTYEAFEWAEKESRVKEVIASPSPLGRRPLDSPPVALINPPALDHEELKESMDGLRLEFPPFVLATSLVKQYEELKSSVLTGHPDGSIRTILVAGTAHGEGASTTAIRFAATLAKDPHLRVLLIEANLRTPGIHRVLGIDDGHGLSDLANGNGCKPYPVKVGHGTIHLVPCGRRDTDPVALFESDQFDRLLKSAQESYSHVVLDAPPILGFAECRVLCTKVDGVIMVIEYGKTRLQVAMSAKKQLEDAGGRILGVVLNKRKYYIPDFIYRRL